MTLGIAISGRRNTIFFASQGDLVMAVSSPPTSSTPLMVQPNQTKQTRTQLLSCPADLKKLINNERKKRSEAFIMREIFG